MSQFLSGCMMMASLTAALLFLRCWKKTDDRLFAIFALAFTVLGINRIAMLFADESKEVSSLVFYAVRLVAFLLILVAIIDKNHSGHSSTVKSTRR